MTKIRRDALAQALKADKAAPEKKPPAKSASAAPGAKPTTAADGFTAAAKSTKAPKVVMVANTDYAPTLMNMLDSAKTSIDIVQYNFFSESGTGKAIADKLIALKTANPALKIRVFMEGDHGDAAARNLTTYNALKAAGIDVELDSKNLITHAKGVCVDGSQVLAGSTNMTNTSMNDNNEVSLQFNSKTIAKKYESYFNQLMTDPSNLHSETTKVGNVSMITDANYDGELLDTINGAKNTLTASMYDFNDVSSDTKAQQVMTALLAAAKRGVKVTMMLEQSSANFAPAITKANEAAYKTLKAAGVDVHLDSPAQISHQKFIVADGNDVLLGSSNWTTSDFDQRHQLNWRVEDANLGAQLTTQLTGEIAKDGNPPVKV